MEECCIGVFSGRKKRRELKRNGWRRESVLPLSFKPYDIKTVVCHLGLKLLYGPGSRRAHGSSTSENKTITKYNTKIQPEGMISVCVCVYVCVCKRAGGGWWKRERHAPGGALLNRFVTLGQWC